MPSESPLLIVVLGLPGTGKTTFARALAARTGALHLFTDRIRTDMGRRGHYGEKDKARVYDEMLRLAAKGLKEGKDVIADGTFYQEALRERFAQLAGGCGAAIYWIELVAAPETVRQRVSARREFSEADFDVYRKVRENFEPVKTPFLRLDTDRLSMEEMLEEALNYTAR